MSAEPTRIDLTPELPQEAVDLYRDLPNFHDEYDVISAKEAGYDGRDGDVGELIQEAADNDQIVDLEGGEYQMDSSVRESSGVMGVIGNGSGSATIHYTGTHLDYLFRPVGLSEFILAGVTFDISEPADNGLDTDVGLVYSEIEHRCWVDDIEFLGQRHQNQDIDGDGELESVGGRMTFLIQMSDSDAKGLVNKARFPDGGTDEHQTVGTVGHAIGPNSDPDHDGLLVWRKCLAQGFMDNGFYVAHAPGRNVLWDCHAKNNGAGNMRLGDNDIVVGGVSEVYDLPEGRQGKPLESDVGDNIRVVGLQLYAEGDVIRSAAQLIQLRSNFEGMELDRVVAQLKDSHHIARFDEGTVDVKDCYFYQEGCNDPAVQIGARGNPADVTAENLRVRAEDEIEFDGPITIDGEEYSGRTTAEEAGVGDPRPFPEFYFSPLDGDDGDDGDDTPDEELVSAMEEHIHQETNEYRSEQGLDSLIWRDDVADVSRSHSQDMQERDFFDHENPDGENAGDRLDDAGIDVRGWAENISYRGRGSITASNHIEVAQDIIDGWLDSSGHRGNIEGSYDAEGVGVHIDDGTAWATTKFVSTSDDGDDGEPEPEPDPDPDEPEPEPEPEEPVDWNQYAEPLRRVNESLYETRDILNG